MLNNFYFSCSARGSFCFLLLRPCRLQISTPFLQKVDNIYILNHKYPLMPIRQSTILLLFFSFTFTGIRAQYLFDNLKPHDGLSSREILSVYPDEEGFIWMGTLNGLDRFDGSHIRVWNNSSPAYPASLGERIFCITEFGKNKI